VKLGQARQGADVSLADGKRPNPRLDDVFLPPGERVGDKCARLPRLEDQFP
jgi:hypothetical protein